MLLKYKIFFKFFGVVSKIILNNISKRSFIKFPLIMSSSSSLTTNDDDFIKKDRRAAKKCYKCKKGETIHQKNLCIECWGSE